MAPSIGTHGTFAALALTVTMIIIGCAVPGEPGPRRPLVPEAVRDLAARQLGDAVVLNFTLPRNSVDQHPLTEPPTVDIYRSALLPAITPAVAAAPAQIGASPLPPQRSLATGPATPLRLIHTIPGDAAGAYERNGGMEFHDPLDLADLERSPGGSLLYQVRTRFSAKHSSAPSNSFTLRVYPPPSPAAVLRATVTQDTILLSWTASSPAAGSSAAVAGYHVYRAEVDPANVAAAAANPEKAQLRTAPELLADAPQAPYRDERFEFDRTYLYIVRSLAQWGTDTVESADSTPVVVSAKDVFPPSAPQGLEIVVTPATPAAAASIELVWAISPEPDFAGYEVYRSEQLESIGQRLNSDLLPAPTFRDMTVTPGRQYFYRVRAVDRAGNESPFSASVAGRFPEPQP